MDVFSEKDLLLIRAARKEYQRNYYKKNREKLNAYQRERYANQQEKAKEYLREWRKKNPEKTAVYMQNYWLKKAKKKFNITDLTENIQQE